MFNIKRSILQKSQSLIIEIFGEIEKIRNESDGLIMSIRNHVSYFNSCDKNLKNKLNEFIDWNRSVPIFYIIFF